MIDSFINTLENIERNSKRLVKTQLIANFIDSNLKKIDKSLIYLFMGRIYPESSDKKTYVSDKLIIKALSSSLGFSEESIKTMYNKKGDLGKVTFELLKDKKQQTLFSSELSIELLITNLNKLEEQTGEKSIAKKVSIISELLTAANSQQGKFIVRLLLENLRIGVSIQTLRDALIQVFFPKVNNIFKKCPDHGYSYDTGKCLICKKELEDIPLKTPDHYDSLNEIDFKKELYTFVEYADSRKYYNDLVELMNKKYSFINDIGELFELLKKDPNNIFEIKLNIDKPIKAMLFQKVKTIKDAFEQVGLPAQIEYKYDGFRMLIHYKDKNNISIRTRNLEEVSDRFKDVVVALKKSIGDKKNIILDGEAVGFKNGEIIPFQQVSQRIMRKFDIDKVAKQYPMKLVLFDILMNDSKDLTKESMEKRRDVLESVVNLVDKKIDFSKKLVTDSKQDAQDFYQKALLDGMEGVMFKNLSSPYVPGSRSGHGVKLKPVLKELDLVITRAEYGTGKRAGLLTSYYVSCLDNGSLKEVGKVSSGVKEKYHEVTYDYITQLLSKKTLKEEDGIVYVDPSVIVELEYEEIQKSSNYESGYALRFPRIVRLRPDKSLTELSNIAEIKKIYNNQRGRNGNSF